jgi:hypothetical protein
MRLRNFDHRWLFALTWLAFLCNVEQAIEQQRVDEEKRAADARHKKELAEQFRADRAAYDAARRVMELEQAAQEAEEKKKMIESARPKVEQREIQRQRKLDAMRSKQVQRHLISRPECSWLWSR